MKALLTTTAIALCIATPALASRHPTSIERTQSIFDPGARIDYPTDQPIRTVRRKHPFRHTAGAGHGHRRTSRHSAAHGERAVSSGRHKPAAAQARNGVSETPALATPVMPEPLLVLATDGSSELFMDGMAAPKPVIVHRRPRLIEGTLRIGDLNMAYASGGNGWSIPYGSFPVTPEDVGPWGKRHHAIGLNEDTIPDKQLGRDRDGIEIHASNHMASSGCVVVPFEAFPKLKAAIEKIIGDVGHAFLHVTPFGAAITADRLPPFPPIIYLAEHGDDEQRRREGKHHHYAHYLPHRHHFAHHRNTKMAMAK